MVVNDGRVVEGERMAETRRKSLAKRKSDSSVGGPSEGVARDQDPSRSGEAHLMGGETVWFAAAGGVRLSCTRDGETTRVPAGVGRR